MSPWCLTFLLCLLSQGNPEDSTENPSPVSFLSHYDLDEPNPRTLKMPGKLSEISGLAISSDGRVFTHNDESPIVYVINLQDGEIVKRFTVGSGFMEEDFEGIAVKRDTLFLVNSSGDIFAFRESGDREHSNFQLYKTPLSARNDVEGLEYDAETDCLLLACKGDPGKGFDGNKSVYAFSLRTRKLEADPRYLIPAKDSKGKKSKSFNPSGIAFHPVTGTLFVISADGRAMLEMDRHGTILGQAGIPSKTNAQPEGIVFLKDGTMLIANDGQGERGTVTVYPPKKR